MNLENRIDDLKPLFKNPKKLGAIDITDEFNSKICTTDSEWARDRIFGSITELDQLRNENARLTEIAAEKATRMDWPYKSLTGMLEQFGEPDGADFY